MCLVDVCHALDVVTSDVGEVVVVSLGVADFEASACDVVACAFTVTPIDVVLDVVVCGRYTALYVLVVGLLSVHCLLSFVFYVTCGLHLLLSHTTKVRQVFHTTKFSVKIISPHENHHLYIVVLFAL